jgi:hypothetical protein
MSVETPAVVTAVITAANLGDTDAFLDGFTDDGVVDDWGRQFRGIAAMRGWSDDEFIGKQVSLDVEDVTEDGDDVVVKVDVGGNGFTGRSTFTFTVSGDKVKQMTIRE